MGPKHKYVVYFIVYDGIYKNMDPLWKSSRGC